MFSGNIIVLASQATVNLPMPPTGVNLTENDNDNTTCLNSTLTFTGTVADLEQLNGGVLTCIDGADASVTDTVTIVIPGENSLMYMNIQWNTRRECKVAITCDVIVVKTKVTNAGTRCRSLTHLHLFFDDNSRHEEKSGKRIRQSLGDVVGLKQGVFHRLTSTTRRVIL